MPTIGDIGQFAARAEGLFAGSNGYMMASLRGRLKLFFTAILSRESLELVLSPEMEHTSSSSMSSKHSRTMPLLNGKTLT